MRKYTICLMPLVFVIVMAALCAVSAEAGGPSQPQFSLYVRGLDGWTTTTSSSMEALIQPPFFNNGEGNVAFAYPVHADNFTVGYWKLDGEKLSTQAMAQPYQSGNFQFIGFIEVGAADTRTSLSFDWWVNNYQSNLTWFVQLYRCDTRRLVFRSTILPGGTNNWGTITASTSRTGYDLLVAAWPSTPVPEPGSFFALGSGLIGLAGVALRRRS